MKLFTLLPGIHSGSFLIEWPSIQEHTFCIIEHHPSPTFRPLADLAEASVDLSTPNFVGL